MHSWGMRSRTGGLAAVLKRGLAVSGIIAISLTAGASGQASAAPATPTVSWSNITPSSSDPGHVLGQPVYDASTSQLLLFEQTATGSTTWVWSGQDWSVASEDTIGANTSKPGLVAYDASTSQLVLVLADGTYTWSGSSWTRAASDSPVSIASASGDAGIGPGASLAFDPATAQLIEIQGEPGNSPVPTQTWNWDGSGWSELNPATSPPERLFGALAYDTAAPELVLFGGSGSNGLLSDTWTWDGINWTQQILATSPSPRQSAGFQYDHGSGQMLLFGGYGPVSGQGGVQGLDDTWTWDGSQWSPSTPATTPSLGASIGAGTVSFLAWDAATSQMILFWTDETTTSASVQNTWAWNGSDWADATPGPSSPDGGVQSSAAWDAETNQLIDVADGATYSWSGTSWDQLSAAGPPVYGSLAYDAFASQLLWVQQAPSGSGPCATWEWNGSQWSQLTPATEAPTVQGAASLAYDSSSSQLVYVGDVAIGATQTEETWTWDGANWTEQAPAASPPPSMDSSVAYDPATQGLLLYGGFSVSSGLPQTDTWIWNGATWSLLSPTTSPPRLADAGLAFDPDLGQLVLFGGDSGATDTWTWNGTTWSQLTTAQAPADRALPGLIWDPATSQMLMVGGSYGGTVRAAGADTWALTSAAIPAPQITSATAQGFAVALSWTPADLGHGVDITGYAVTAYPGGDTITLGNVLSYTYTGLTPGTAYQFTVTPLNSAGTYPSSPLSATATPLGTQGPPQGVALTCGDGAATLAWQPPAPTPGAAPVTGYELFDITSGTKINVGSSTLSYTFTGLQNGTGVLYSIEAINQYGPSPQVQTANCFPYASVGAPTILSLTAGDGQATVTWSPAAQGNQPITGYEILATSAHTVVDVGPAVTSYLFTGVPDDVACLFYVQAIDADGLGPPSADFPPVVPAPTSEVPSVTAATAGPGTATIAWAPPKVAAKSPITAYRVVDSAGAVTVVPASATSVKFTRLKEGATYTFTVSAQRLVGAGPRSAPRSVKVVVPPGVPQKLAASAGVREVTLTWSPPTSTGGDPLSGYTLKAYDCAAGSNPCKQVLVRTITVGANVLRQAVSNLVGGKPYWFDVAARSAAGTGRATTKLESTPRT